LNSAYSLHRRLLLLFFLFSTLTFVIPAGYAVYDYRKELKLNLENSLLIMAEDVVRHKLYTQSTDELLKLFQFLEAYHAAPHSDLLDQLGFFYDEERVLERSGVHVRKSLPDGRELFVYSSWHAVDEKSSVYGVKLLTAFLLLELLGLWLLNLWLRRMLQPLQCLKQFCKDSSIDASSSVTCGGAKEFRKLYLAIVDLIEANRDACKDKEDIFKEAAHEIKAPIAIMKARLGLFKQSDGYDRALFIEESEEDLSRISHKLKELIFLKSVEWDLRRNKETVSMQNQCMLVQEMFMPVREKKGLKIQANWKEDFALTIHKEAMQKVIQAIFENIFLHTKNNTVIEIDIDAKQKCFSIKNEIGHSSDDKLFSSGIGSKLIERLSEEIGFTYEAQQKSGYYYTHVQFK